LKVKHGLVPKAISFVERRALKDVCTFKELLHMIPLGTGVLEGPEVELCGIMQFVAVFGGVWGRTIPTHDGYIEEFGR
jgi:hypothetical protein